MPPSLQVRRFESIHDVEESLWDSINPKGDFFHSHRFIQAVEDAGLAESRFWYLLFYNDNKPVGSAALSAFTVSLDLFLGRTCQRIVGRIRRRFPHFLKLTILFCGLPISIGKHNLVIGTPSYMKDILKGLVQEMQQICTDFKIHFMCVKEFSRHHLPEMDLLTGQGFFRAHSIPYVSLSIRWPDFGAYLAALRHNYRRQVRQSLKKMGDPENKVEIRHCPPPASPRPGLILGQADVCSAEQFFKLYREVMKKAGVQLEVLNRAFFENLFAKMQDQVEILTFQQGGDVLGAALLCCRGKTMTFLLVGLDYSRRDEYDVYFNLIYGIVKLAIDRKYERLNLGQTSYYIKQRIGGTCLPIYFYLKSTSAPLHFSLKAFKKSLFPEPKVPTLEVFKRGDA